MIVGSDGKSDGSQAEADDLRYAHFVMADSSVKLGNHTGTNMHVHAVQVSDASLISSSHHYGYSTCENLKGCNTGGTTGEVAGSTCAITRHTTTVTGYCYESDLGSLECGRTIEIEERYTGKKTDTTSSTVRCPAGTALSKPGRLSTKRMLLAGCMKVGDPYYSALAEMHVPEACFTLEPLGPSMTGCMFPGALNYVSGVKQYSACLYPTLGCMDANALNFNSEATVSDGSCVLPTYGCTVKPDNYDGVPADTPGFQSTWVEGKHPNAPYNAPVVWTAGSFRLTGYNPAANTNSGCGVEVEGCMDSTAVNYNPLATHNSNTWCVPKVTGCMMPSPDRTGTLTSLSTDRDHLKDGGSGSYSLIATVHDPAQCNVGRSGCTSVSALNYDPLATYVPGPWACYEPIEGCLDPTALNFNCTSTDPNPDGTFSHCSPGIDAPRATVHAPFICAYGYNPPPSPAPGLPASVVPQVVIEISFVAGGSVDDFSTEDIAAVGEQFATALGVDPSQVIVVLVPASVIFKVQIKTEPEAAAALETAVSTQLTDKSSIETIVAASGVTVQVVSAPVVKQAIIAAVVPPAPPPAVNTGAIIGGIVGGLVAVLLLGGCFMMYQRRKAKTTYPA
jgi:hypothetical protein